MFQGNDTTPGDGFTFTVNPSLYTHGSEHTLTAQAFDTAGRSDATPAGVDFTIDRQTSTAITGPAAGGHFQARAGVHVHQGRRRHRDLLDADRRLG